MGVSRPWLTLRAKLVSISKALSAKGGAQGKQTTASLQVVRYNP